MVIITLGINVQNYKTVRIGLYDIIIVLNTLNSIFKILKSIC